MTWSDVFLFCFALGFAFSAISYVAGGLHWHVHIGPHGTGGGPHVASGSRINFVTLAAFLAWFGGIGYLLSRYSASSVLLTLVVAGISGFVGASVVSLFLTRVLMSADENMDAADYEMVGVLGRVSSVIRENGTGEILFSQAGTRRGCAARSEDGRPMDEGIEVLVTRYEHGIAYVRNWRDVEGDDRVGS